MIVAAVQVLILLLVGAIGFGVHLPDNLAAFLIAVVVGMVSFSALGLAMSTLIPNQDAAGPIVSIVFFVLLFLSGSVVPAPTRFGAGPGLRLLPRSQLHLGGLRTVRPAKRCLALVMARSPGRCDLGCARRDRGGAALGVVTPAHLTRAGPNRPRFPDAHTGPYAHTGPDGHTGGWIGRSPPPSKSPSTRPLVSIAGRSGRSRCISRHGEHRHPPRWSSPSGGKSWKAPTAGGSG